MFVITYSTQYHYKSNAILYKGFTLLRAFPNQFKTLCVKSLQAIINFKSANKQMHNSKCCRFFILILNRAAINLWESRLRPVSHDLCTCIHIFIFHVVASLITISFMCSRRSPVGISSW